MDVFEKAGRLKLRFNTIKGGLAVEDLWDIPLVGDFSLDELAKSLNRAIKQNADESFVVQAKKDEKEVLDELRFDIVKHIISVKLADIEDAENATARKTYKEKLLTIIAGKKDAKLEGKSLKDLEKMVDAL